MAPHVHRLSAYASQRLVSLFDMLSRKYVSSLLFYVHVILLHVKYSTGLTYFKLLCYFGFSDVDFNLGTIN